MPGPRDKWWHIAFGNLNQSTFTFTPLRAVRESICPDGSTVDMELVAGSRPMNKWRACQGFDLGRKWDVDLWKISSSAAPVAHFLPSQFQAVRVQPLLRTKLWRPAGGHGPGPVPLDHQQLPAALLLPDPLAQKPARAPPPQPLPPPAAAAGGAPPSCIWLVPQGDEVDGRLAVALGRLHNGPPPGGNDAGRDTWDIPSSAESGGDHPPPVRPVPPPPPQPLQPPLAQAAGDEGGGGHDSEKQPWHNVDLPGLAKFVLDETSQNHSIGMRCHRHGCRFNRVISKSPVGYFMALLEAGAQCATQAEHMAMRLCRDPAGVLSFARRSRGRDRARRDPRLARVLNWEGQGRLVEEPVDLGR